MRTLILCPALLVMSVLTTPADGGGLWDRIKSGLPTAAGEPEYVDFQGAASDGQFVDAEYMDADPTVIVSPDGSGYPDADLDYNSCGCGECKEPKGLCSKCLDYMKQMWSRVSRRDRHCCQAPPEFPSLDCCEEAPCCCEPPKRTCCCLDMLRRLPWRLRLDKLWAKADGCGTYAPEETIIDEYYEVPGEAAPYTIETVPPSASINRVEDPMAAAARPAERRRARMLLRQTRREAVNVLPEHPGV